MEASLANAMGGISNILSFMCDIKRHFAKEAGVKTTDEVEGMPLVGVEVGTPPLATACACEDGGCGRGKHGYRLTFQFSKTLTATYGRHTWGII